MSSEDVLAVHYGLVRVFAEEGDPIAPAGSRPGGLLESAVGRPQTSLGKVEKYPSLELKAAALFHSLATGHPFHNGNKRTALVATLAFLERNDRRFSAGDDELFDFVLAVANRSRPFEGAPDDVVERIANWLHLHLLAERSKVHGMRFNEFLDRCEEAGCTYRQTKKGRAGLFRG